MSEWNNLHLRKLDLDLGQFDWLLVPILGVHLFQFKYVVDSKLPKLCLKVGLVKSRTDLPLIARRLRVVS